MIYLLLLLVSPLAQAGWSSEHCAYVKARMQSLPGELNQAANEVQQKLARVSNGEQELARAEVEVKLATRLIEAASGEAAFIENSREASGAIFPDGPEVNVMRLFQDKQLLWKDSAKASRRLNLRKDLESFGEQLNAARSGHSHAASSLVSDRDQVAAAQVALANLERESIETNGLPSRKELELCSLWHP